MELTHISLFAGIAGIDLAAEWAGFETILFVEIDKYCQKILKKHWPNVPIIGDIRDVTKEALDDTTGAGYMEQPRKIKTKQGSNWQENGLPIKASQDATRGANTGVIPPITLITGGFPCQPVSHAGKRRGKEDDRWLWPEMFRVISEVKPTWVVAENVAGLLNMGFNDCVSDLESEGYEVQSFLIPACAVNAPHRRDRIFIVAYYEGSGLRPQFNKITDKLLSKNRSSQKPEGGIGYASNSKGERLEGSEPERSAQSWGCPTECIGSNWWAVEPELGRVAHGISHRVDRLKCLGNAVVPQQIYPILKAIADIESNNKFS